MKTYKLINPLIIFDKFDNYCKAKDVYEAIDKIYINYTNFFIKPHTPITYMSLKDENNKLHHFQINEKSKKDITYKITKIHNDNKKDLKFSKMIKNINLNNIDGGRYSLSDSDDSDYDSDSDFEYKKKKKYKSRSRSTSSSSDSDYDYKKKSKKKHKRKYSSDSSNSSNSSDSSISLNNSSYPLYYYCPDLYDNNYLYMPNIYYILDKDSYQNNSNLILDALL
jgi:hypothetical protein